MSKEIAIVEPMKRLTVKEVMAQVGAIQEMMGSVMKDGQHYGVIPGCGTKPALYKSGAEKIAFMFQLRADFEMLTTELDNDHREYQFTCHMMSGENIVGSGFGLCSTMEKKFRYRKNETTGEIVGPIPKGYWDAKKAGDDKAMKTISGGNRAKKTDNGWFFVKPGKSESVENPDLADSYNTVLKMAKKRAFVDAIITSTAASDFFTQDIEDFKGSFQEEEQKINKSRETEKEVKPEPDKPAQGKPVKTAKSTKKNTVKEKNQVVEDAVVVEEGSIPEASTEHSDADTKTLNDLVSQLMEFGEEQEKKGVPTVKISKTIASVSKVITSGNFSTERVDKIVAWAIGIMDEVVADGANNG